MVPNKRQAKQNREGPLPTRSKAATRLLTGQKQPIIRHKTKKKVFGSHGKESFILYCVLNVLRYLFGQNKQIIW